MSENKYFHLDYTHEELEALLDKIHDGYVLSKEQYEKLNKISEQGIQGPKGDKGDTGPMGPQGEQGPAGKDAEFDREKDIELYNANVVLEGIRDANLVIGSRSGHPNYWRHYTASIGLSHELRENYSMAIGCYNYNAGENTLTVGSSNEVVGNNSIAIGYHTRAEEENQFVQGKYNKPMSNMAHIVGNGSGLNDGKSRSNAYTLDWDGNGWFQGNVFIGGTSSDDAKKLATEDMVIALQQQIEQLQSTITELTQVPEIVIANKNIESEMEYLNERTQDENVIGIIIEPYIIPESSGEPFESYSLQKFKFYLNIELVNNKVTRFNSIIEDKINDIKKIYIQLKEENIYNVERNNCYIDCHDNNAWTSFMNYGNYVDFSRELLKKVHYEETDLKINLIIHSYISSNELKSISYCKPFEIVYSTKVKVYRYYDKSK